MLQIETKCLASHVHLYHYQYSRQFSSCSIKSTSSSAVTDINNTISGFSTPAHLSVAHETFAILCNHCLSPLPYPLVVPTGKSSMPLTLVEPTSTISSQSTSFLNQLSNSSASVPSPGKATPTLLVVIAVSRYLTRPSNYYVTAPFNPTIFGFSPDLSWLPRNFRKLKNLHFLPLLFLSKSP